MNVWQGLIGPPGANTGWQLPASAPPLPFPVLPHPSPLQGSSSRELVEANGVAVLPLLKPRVRQRRGARSLLPSAEIQCPKHLPTSPGTDLG